MTLNEAVEVAARAGLEARPDARKPKANANNVYFIDFTPLVTPEKRLSNLVIPMKSVLGNLFLQFYTVL